MTPTFLRHAAVLRRRLNPGHVAAVLRRLRLAPNARRQRLSLAKLDDAMLRDIGITRAQALAEAARPAWDVPAHWLR